MKLSLILDGLEDTAALAGRLAALLRQGDAVLLDGALGAGKSALARALLRALTGDPALHVPSPTFTLMQGYDTPVGPVAHFDLWRLDGEGAVAELGWDEAREGIVLVEWPDRLGTLAPEDALRISLQDAGGERRLARLDGWPDRLPSLATPGLAR